MGRDSIEPVVVEAVGWVVDEIAAVGNCPDPRVGIPEREAGLGRPSEAVQDHS